MEIEGANLTLKKGNSYAKLSIGDTGYVRMVLIGGDHSGDMTPDGIYFTNDPETAGYHAAASMGIDPVRKQGVVRTQAFNDKTVSWKSNGDGTYTLIGED